MNNEEIHARILELEKTLEKFQNKLVSDANGVEIIFPDVEPGDQYGVGDKVELPDDKKTTFERVMPDGSTIVVKDGILKKIIPAEDEETVKAQKVFNCGYSAKTVEIFSESKSEPYKVGNKVRVNGKEGVMFGRFRNGNIQISVLEGEISAIKNIGSKVLHMKQKHK